MPASKPRVALFVTCLVDLFRPNVGFAAVRLLERAGCAVTVPATQTCCGQPAYNGGARAAARAIARQVVRAFRGFDVVVAPSGSCAGMLKRHYPDLLAGSDADAAAARDLAARTWELTAFLAECGLPRAGAAYGGICTYHDSCSSLRELGVRAAPRRLLAEVDGLALRELAQPEVCCGFGGTFCVKYPDISNQMARDKAADIAASGADTVLSGDLGCLLNIAGYCRRRGTAVKAYHVAEVLAGMAAGPAIGAIID